MTAVRSSTAAAIVSSEKEPGSRRAGARRSTPVSRASLSQGYVTLGNSRSAETTFSRAEPPRDLAERFRGVGHDRHVVGTGRKEPCAAARGVPDPLLDLVVEADGPAACDLPAELLAGCLHRDGLEADRARVEE